ncbi:DUF4197 domain-containing protein [Galbibacter orientalis]|mgnify:CR=1 FL=1|uniref:DUF4197 domain-containing protein n=1 Tax=Galbibacter orientalis DSM 19592 TaxID=926559 RepID=I3C7S2_9FLAO|nr:DUF4197 domain-containing protein [Galbibacter orientalis]EIJ39665.1 hypothetical protein JoomaDRAFT_2694 [Galbibacter orientalis DSM 19592]
MIRKILTVVVLTATLLSLNSCDTLNTAGNTSQNSNVALNTVQSVLNNGTQEAFSVFGDSNEFMTNALIDAAMPQKLKDINNKLESLGLSSVVAKEKALISDIANASITTARPIVTKAINEMTTQDAIAIISGGKDAATSYLKDKTYNDLTTAIAPVVTDKTESLGINSLLNNALGGNNSSLNGVLGAVLGTGSTASGSEQLNDAVTKQLVDGLFNIVEQTENNVRSNPSTILNSVLSN